MTHYLGVEQVLFIHHRVIMTTGGEFGVRDLPRLISAGNRPQATFDGKDLYDGIYSKAAALFDSLIRNHPFVDGNKRTAITAAGIFLSLNGCDLRVSHVEMVRFTMRQAQTPVETVEISLWFEKHCQNRLSDGKN